MDNHKKTLLQALLQEQKNLRLRKDELIDKIHANHVERNTEENDLTVYNYNNDLQFILTQMEKLTGTISSIKQNNCNNAKKSGDRIKVGDCVQVHSEGAKTYYYITNANQYIDPRLGLISENSPLANKILDKKFGDQITIGFNGDSKSCKLLP